MKSYKLIGLMFLLIVYLMPEYCAFETSIQIIEKVNLSFDPGQGYEIYDKGIKDVDEDSFSRNFFINSTSTENNALLSIGSIFSLTDNIDPVEFSNYMADILVGAYKLAGGKEIGIDFTNSTFGQNVKIITLFNSKSENQTVIASWVLDRDNFAFVISDDSNLTRRSVETLEIKS